MMMLYNSQTQDLEQLHLKQSIFAIFKVDLSEEKQSTCSNEGDDNSTRISEDLAKIANTFISIQPLRNESTQFHMSTTKIK